MNRKPDLPEEIVTPGATESSNRRKLGMTKPRTIIPGTTYKLTRRCHERRFFLAPNSTELVDAMYYVLFEAAQHHKVDLACAIFMSNHHHTDYSDPLGKAPQFYARLHRHLARMVDCYRGRWDGFWEAKQPHNMPILDAESVMESMVYTALNPIRAGLVHQVRFWPGVKVLPSDLLKAPRTFKRPDFFFRSEERGGRMPAEVQSRVVKPPQFAHLSDEDYVAEFERRLAVGAREARKAVQRHKRKKRYAFLGAERVRNQDYRRKPGTPAPRRVERPRLKASDPIERTAALEERATFLAEYGRVLRIFREQPRRRSTVLFPCGTWQMRRRHNVRCHSPPSTT